MTLKTVYVTDSIDQWKRGPQLLWRLSPRAADRASLCVAPTSSYSLGNQMSPAGLQLLEERFERLKTASTPQEVQAVYADIRRKAEAIPYPNP